MPSISWRKSSEVGDLDSPLDHGFDNPMFDKNTLMPSEPGLYGESVNSISMTQTGVHFVNPAYDETDFNEKNHQSPAEFSVTLLTNMIRKYIFNTIIIV